MKTLNCNAYTIKWAIIMPVFGKFNRNYQSALKKAGFHEIGDAGIFGNHFNSQNPDSIERFKNDLDKLKKKIESYKRRYMILAFIITDKQLGLIGTDYAEKLKHKPGWVGVPFDDNNSKFIPVTYNQMYASGAIRIRGAQGSGKYGLTFKGDSFKLIF